MQYLGVLFFNQCVHVKTLQKCCLVGIPWLCQICHFKSSFTPLLSTLSTNDKKKELRKFTPLLSTLSTNDKKKELRKFTPLLSTLSTNDKKKELRKFTPLLSTLSTNDKKKELRKFTPLLSTLSTNDKKKELRKFFIKFCYAPNVLCGCICQILGSTEDGMDKLH